MDLYIFRCTFYKVRIDCRINSSTYFTYPFKRQSHKMVKHTQTIRRQFADELFECVWSFCEIGP